MGKPPSPSGAADLRSGLGVLLPSGPGAATNWTRAGEEFATLDDEGCSAIWISDHLFWGVDVPEALTMCAVAVGATRRCAIGTGVLQLPLRQPAAVAKAGATLQQVSGGRFILGIGSGVHRREYERVGVDFDSRGRAVDQALAAIEKCWHTGDQFYEQRPEPSEVPVWFGGQGRRVLTRVVEKGDGWLPIFMPAERVAEGATSLHRMLDRAGRSRDDVTVGAVVITAVTDGAWTRADALAWMGELWGADPTTFERHLVSGSADECVDALRTYRDAGVDHLAVLPASREPVATFAALARSYEPPGPQVSNRMVIAK